MEIPFCVLGGDALSVARSECLACGHTLSCAASLPMRIGAHRATARATQTKPYISLSYLPGTEI